MCPLEVEILPEDYTRIAEKVGQLTVSDISSGEYNYKERESVLSYLLKKLLRKFMSITGIGPLIFLKGFLKNLVYVLSKYENQKKIKVDQCIIKSVRRN